MTQKAKLGMLLVLVGILVSINVLRRSSPAAATPEREAARVPAGTRAGVLAFPDSLLEIARRDPTKGVSSGPRRNIFEYAAQAASVPAQAAATAAAPPAAAPPRPAPVRFYGFVESSAGGKRQVFLTDGDEIYVAAEGDVILKRYRLARVRNESVEVEDLVGNQRWVVSLEQP
ncbi:MAG: hypothetical protein HY656_07765 [Acidobacteria bacterium]|nr:hypothetical protein [Acidobacteriota bacterium]